MDPYTILGVSSGASKTEIKKAYKKLASKHHPDRGGDTAKFQEIQKAYNTLKNPKPADQHTHFNFNTGDAMNDFFFNRMRPPQKNNDIHVNVSLNLCDMLEDQSVTVSIARSLGKTMPVKIIIPKGTINRSTIKYVGLGDNLAQQLTPGDLYATIIIISPVKFKIIDDYTIATSLTIDAFDAMAGTSKEIAGINDKKFNLKIPKSTQPNTKFSLKGQGLFNQRLNRRADMIVNINISIPILTDKQLQIIEPLRKSK